VLFACAPDQDNHDAELPDLNGKQESVEEARGDKTETDVDAVITSDFEPVEGVAGESVEGTVSVLEGTEPTDDYRLAVHIEGLTPGEHAWHIHAAPCGKDGPVVVPFTETEDGPGLAQPLSPSAGGVAEAKVAVPQDKLSLEQLKSGEYSLHVHEKGGVDHGATVACANL
jgi:Cu/Zn superoxide dismutase